MQAPINCTLLDLVQQVNETTDNDNEAVATIVYMINSGRVRLCGTFAGAKIRLPFLSSVSPKQMQAQRSSV